MYGEQECPTGLWVRYSKGCGGGVAISGRCLFNCSIWMWCCWIRMNYSILDQYHPHTTIYLTHRLCRRRCPTCYLSACLLRPEVSAVDGTSINSENLWRAYSIIIPVNIELISHIHDISFCSVTHQPTTWSFGRRSLLLLGGQVSPNKGHTHFGGMLLAVGGCDFGL